MIVLRGRLRRALARGVVVLLVLLGFGSGRARGKEPAPAPVPGGDDGAGAKKKVDELPADVDTVAIAGFLAKLEPTSAFGRGVEIYVSLAASPGTAADDVERSAAHLRRSFPPKLADLLLGELATRVAGLREEPRPPAELLDVLAELEKKGLYDAFAAGAVWRHVPAAAGLDEAGRANLVRLLARLRRFARVRDTLVKAKAEVKPASLEPRAWMSKAGRPIVPPEILARERREMLKAARKHWPFTEAGTFDRDATAVLEVAEGSPALALVRGGKRVPLEAGDEFRFGRLDLLEVPPGDAPAVVTHARYGRIGLPPGTLTGARDLPALLNETSRATIMADVKLALAGDEAAGERLERALPLVAPALRVEVAESPAAPGAPLLRTILTLFDDLPTPPPK